MAPFDQIPAKRLKLLERTGIDMIQVEYNISGMNSQEGFYRLLFPAVIQGFCEKIWPRIAHYGPATRCIGGLETPSPRP